MKKELNTLLIQLYLAEEIYKKAAKMTTNAQLEQMLNEWALQKKTFIEKIAQEQNVDMNKLKLKFKLSFQLSVDKLGMDLDSFFAKNNDREILKMAIKWEHRLHPLYEQLLSKIPDFSFFKEALTYQMYCSSLIISEMKEIRESYLLRLQD